mmetsp:Transcript_16915/g.41202  ORF Transcript_16915/g.41202 Transcript_16915/m.41202 type:complete len:322 (+) Transcript_16915:78-1043(+)|eukprot:CAMPEP_0113614370 /NCGR_PEP_ID=MMETSP0017_2-20120614/7128_1 /TAXON_ID=2856 /ORGANISM="Cylindrotheca closterium" /LENGTH=321 /DNA_ID=CAMNT_0000523529 /DNA_START=50 /DNA_END=1015 /DNA_ORIENTATION=- /assembly_acc=CAM_ASM_000147
MSGDGLATPQTTGAEEGCQSESGAFLSPEEKRDTQVTCDVLCSLSASYPQRSAAAEDLSSEVVREKRKPKACPKQHQLPLFLSKTYHMIDRCDPEIATWSASGDNFVVKNVEKFASSVLPLYFKHSNFSSFARQLNFYGFRKLRTDPILTSDVDPRTACYVRFYHDKFQKDRPELLHQIKRATKSDQQNKDEVESLKGEVCKLKECMGQMNHRINTLTSEYEKVATLLTEFLTRSHQQQLQQQQQQQQATQQLAPAAAPQAGAAPRGPCNAPDLMHSLSQVAAASLQRHLQTAVVPTNGSAMKRENPEAAAGSSPSRQRTG